jgi:hypothetical protein
MALPVFLQHIVRSGLISFIALYFLMFACAAIFREIEREQRLSYLDAVEWSVVTICTVGYGNIIPLTT